MTDAWEMHQAETGLNPGPVWRDRGIIINTLTERNQALEERVAELEGSCQRLRDDYQGALAEKNALLARIEALADQWADRRRSDRMSGSAIIGITLAAAASDLRAALAPPSEDTTPTERQAQGGAWVDRQGDLWRFSDGVATVERNGRVVGTDTGERASREYVERKWGPLHPAPVADPSGDTP